MDRFGEAIVAVHFASDEKHESTNIIRGKTAQSILSEIMKRSLVSRIDHASYLGSELEKAEVALRTGKEYIQDNPMFGS